MPKSPLRIFAKYFTNLTVSEQQELERAFLELEDSQEISNLFATLEFLRKKPDQNMPIVQPQVTPLVRGALIEWEPIQDQRITAYEVESSEDVNFATSNITTTFGTQVILEGLDTTTFVRIRGIRNTDFPRGPGGQVGTHGPYSATVIINPKLFNVKSRVEEAFYIRLGNNEPVTVLGGAGSDFEYQPVNPDSFSMTWGQAYLYSDPEIALSGLDDITIKLIGKVVETDIETEYWKVTSADHNRTYSIGPVAIPHPEINQTLQVRVDVQDSAPPSQFYVTSLAYGHLSSLEVGSEE